MLRGLAVAASAPGRRGASLRTTAALVPPPTSKASIPSRPSSSTTSGVDGAGGGGDHPEDAATVVQGPSLLTATSAHRPSPSLFHLPGLRSLPFWTAPDPPPGQEGGAGRRRVAYNDPSVSRAVEIVEGAFEGIRSEYLSAVAGMGTKTDPNSDGGVLPPLEPDYDVNSRGGEHASDALHAGSWDWHSYVLNGEVRDGFAERCPETAAAVDALREEGLLFETPFSFCFFSTLAGGSSIKPHVGPMNLRLRVHLPLVVPNDAGPAPGGKDRGGVTCGLRVGAQVRQWSEGQALVLDDSYEHEVWNNAADPRALLLLDLWHPDVGQEERVRIRNMFDYARGKGWIGKDGSK